MIAATAFAGLVGQGWTSWALSITMGWFLGVLWRMLDDRIMANPKGLHMPKDIRIVTPEEAEKADVVICMPLGPSRFGDNEVGTCADCGIAIMFRPYNPKTPVYVCYECGLRRAGMPEDQIAKYKAERNAAPDAPDEQ